MTEPDLRQNRKIDRLFHFWSKRDGIDKALETWRRLDDYDSKARLHQERLYEMARSRFYDKKTYIDIAKEFNYGNAKMVSKAIKHLEEEIRVNWYGNKKRLENMLKIPPPPMQFYLDPRVILQETCAMHMGGEEMLNTLKQLMNLRKDNEAG
ncbi:hypothetical protein EBT31_07430 [bacterium]|jgi:hypothetical protein|nr:hypothetical protein [bacterium]NBX48480.1 hypothetical protein [bacterium]